MPRRLRLQRRRQLRRGNSNSGKPRLGGEPRAFVWMRPYLDAGHHLKAHLQHQRFGAGGESDDGEIHLRIDAGDFQPQGGGVGQAFDVSP